MFAASKVIQKSARICVVGGGAGGLAVLNGLASSVKDAELTLIEPSEDHYYQPLWTLVGGGVKTAAESQRKMADFIPEKVKWKKNKVASIQPQNNTVELNTGDKVKYDVLVVATGLQINLDKVKGLKESIGKNGLSTNYLYQYAPKTFEFINQTKDGKAIFTVPSTPIKCGGAPQKIMYLAKDIWDAQGVRDNISISFTSAIGKIFAAPKYERALNGICDDYGIERNFGKNLVEVDGEKKEAIFHVAANDSTVVEKYSFMHVTPPMGPVDALLNSNNELTNADGWVDVDKDTLQHNKFANVFSLGDASSIPTSKTAAAIAGQHGVLLANLKAYLNGDEKPKVATYDGYTACPIPVSRKELILAEFDYSLEAKETFFFNQAKPSALMYLTKSELMPRLYWEHLLAGKWHGPSAIRPITNPFGN